MAYSCLFSLHLPLFQSASHIAASPKVSAKVKKDNVKYAAWATSQISRAYQVRELLLLRFGWPPGFSLSHRFRAQSDIQTVEHITRRWEYAMPSRWLCAGCACLGRAQLICWLKPTGPGIAFRSCFLCLHVKAPLSLWSITAGAKHRLWGLGRGKYAVCTPRLQKEGIMIAEERKNLSVVQMVSLKGFILLPWYTDYKYYAFISNLNCHQRDLHCLFKRWLLSVIK